MSEKVSDYLIEYENGYRLEHRFCQYNNVSPYDLEMLQSVIEQRTESYKSLVLDGNYKTAICLLRPNYRPKALYQFAKDKQITPQLAWELARRTWLELEETHSSIDDWELFFSLNLPRKQHFMSANESLHLDAMPYSIYIYRGFECQRGKKGVSWSLSKMIASQYAFRFKALKIAVGVINKDDVIGYINTRGHHEIVVKNRNSLRYLRVINTVRPKSGLIYRKNNKLAVNLTDSLCLTELTNSKMLINQ